MMFGLSEEEACFGAAAVTAGHTPASKVAEQKKGKDNFISIKLDIATKLSYNLLMAKSFRKILPAFLTNTTNLPAFDNLTLCIRKRPRITCFGPQEDRVANDEAGSTFPADRQLNSEILTFKREVKKRKKGGKRTHQTLSQQKRREKTDKKSRFSTEKQPFSDTKHTT